jgi:hypothetical protein
MRATCLIHHINLGLITVIFGEVVNIWFVQLTTDNANHKFDSCYYLEMTII